MDCEECQNSFDPAKDFFVTVHERKGRSRNFCSIPCATKYIDDDEVRS